MVSAQNKYIDYSTIVYIVVVYGRILYSIITKVRGYLQLHKIYFSYNRVQNVDNE